MEQKLGNRTQACKRYEVKIQNQQHCFMDPSMH